MYIAATINMYSWQRLSLLTKDKLTVVPQSPLSPRLCNTKLLNLRLIYSRGTREGLDNNMDWPTVRPLVATWLT